MASLQQPGAADCQPTPREGPLVGAGMRRLIYASHSTCAVGSRAGELRRIVEHAQAFNAAHGVSGLLMASQDRLVQVLDGSPEVIDRLLLRLRADRRHAGFDLLAWQAVDGAAFADWPMGLVERSEPAALLDARLAWLKVQLADGPGLPARELVQFMIAPRPRPALHAACVGDVLLVSPGGLWGPSVLQRAALVAASPIARSTLWLEPQHARRAVVEFVDIEVPGGGAARVLSVTGDWPRPAVLAAALNRLAVVVLMLSPSDLVDPRNCRHCASWLQQLVAAVGQPFELMIVASCERERLTEMMASVPAPARVSLAPLRLSRADGIWEAVLSRLASGAATAGAAGLDVPLAMPPAPPAEAASEAVDAWLKRAQLLIGKLVGEGGIDGVCAAAVVALASTRIFQPPDMPCKDEADLPGLAQFVRDQCRLLERVAPGEALAEAALMTSRHLLLATMLPTAAALEPSCILLALDRSQTSLAAARLRLAQRLEPPPGGEQQPRAS